MTLSLLRKLLLKNFNSCEWVKKLILFFITAILVTGVYANPVLDNVASGNVTVQQTPGSTVVNQTSGQAIINWQSFNIGASESTHFQQPAGGVALNRINPNQGVSQIYGSLSATGQIILINPAGIYFGAGSHVNVGSMIATTANISNQDFLNGYYHFVQDPAFNGSIINAGQIIAANHGLIALIGSNVQNNGLIQANLGHVVLASGGSYTMSFNGNDLVSFSVDSKSLNQGNITNTGTIRANGGQILVTAQAAQNVLDNVINMQGVLEAKSVTTKNGELILGDITIAGDTDAGVVRVAAKINASGKGTKQTGGTVQITGNNILIDSPTSIDVSGDAGGGNIYIGGNFHGTGPLPNANAVAMNSGVTLNADALTNGNGGNIAIWSNYYTNAKGSLSARGGVLGGDGGLIETSSHQYLDANDVTVNTSAANGQYGTWLLDPADLTISTGSNANVTGSNPFEPTAASSVLNVTTLTNALASSDVTVQTGNDAFAGNGDIFVDTLVSWTSAHNLTLSAYRDIVLNSNITNTGGASVNLRADNTGTGIGTVCGNGSTLCGGTPTGTVNLSGGSGVASVYYNPVTFGTPDTIYTGGTTPISYMLINQLGSAGDTTTASLASLSNNSALWNKNFALATNIDASATASWNSGAGFVPIGNSTTNFTGNFDGQGYEIQNLTIDRPSSSDQGFFGVSAGTIRNVGITNANITGSSTVGGLVGLDFGSITGSYSSGTIASQTDTAGGLVGFLSNGGSINNSYSNANVSATTTTAGGLVGFIFNGATVNNSYATGDVSGSGTATTIGGFAGGNDGTITDSYSTGQVSGGTSDVGGFVGEMGSISAGTISDSYSLGNVSGSSSQIGGFIGALDNGTISNSYSIGYVTGSSVLGGFAGSNSGTIQNSFWNTDTSGRSVGVGSGTTPVTLVGGCFSGSCFNGGTANLSSLATYTAAGWDTTNTWNILPGQSYAYQTFFFPNTPRAITTTGVSPPVNTLVKVVANGTNVASGHTYFDGSSYFLLKNGEVADDSPMLIYFSGSTIKANAIAVAPTGGGSLSGSSASVILVPGSIDVGGFFGGVFSNSVLAAAKGSLSDSDILYSVTGNDITLASNTSFTLQSSAAYTLDGNITAPSGSLLFNGPVALPVGITNPVLTTNSATNDISILNDIEGGGNTLTINTAGSFSRITGAISNLSALNKGGTGLLTLSGTSTYDGVTNVNAGTLSITNTAALGSTVGGTVVADGATLNINGIALGAEGLTLNGAGVSDEGALTGTGTASASGTIDLATTSSIGISNSSDTLTLSGVISGSGGLTKEGSGTLALSNANNTYTGQTTLNAGTTSITSLANFGANSSLGAPTSGAITLGSSSAATLLVSGTNSTNRTFSVGGTGGGTIESTGGTLTLSGNISTILNSTLNLLGSGSGIIVSGNISGAGNVSLDSVGHQTFTFSGANSYTGATNVGSAILLDLTSAGALGDGTNNTSGVTVASGGELDINGVNLLASPTLNIAGTGQVGTGVLSGNGTFNGDITLASNATIQATGGTLNLGGSINNAGNPLSINLSSTGTLIASGVISGSGNVSIIGNGSAQFTNTANTYTGQTSVSAATLSIASLADYDIASSLGEGTNGTPITLSNGATLSYTGTDDSSNRQISGSGTISKTSSGTLTLSGDIANNGLIFNAQAGTIASTGVISGSGGLTKAGAGTLSLENVANTYTGQTIINNGTLIAAKIADFGQTSSLGQAASGTIILGNNSGGTTGTLTLTGASDSSNRTFTTQIGGGVIEATTGTVNLSGNIATTGGSPITFDANGGNINESGIISGGPGGGVKVSGDGSSIVTLSAANTYTDTTTINSGGILDVTNTNALGSAANNFGITVNNGGQLRLDLSGGTLANSSTITLNGSGSDGTGALYNTSTSGTNTIANAITLASASTIGADNGGTLSLSGGIDNGGFLLTFTGGSNINVSTGTISGAGGLTKNGSGILTLPSGNTYTGTTTINDGTLRFAGSNVLDDNNIVSIGATGQLDLNNNSDTIGELDGSGTISLGSGTLTVGNLNTSSIYSGVISGTGGLTKIGTGTLTLAGNNNYSGATAISAGTIALGIANALSTSSELNLTSTLDLAGFNQEIDDVIGSGTITNSGSSATVTFNNAGALAFNGLLTGTNLNLEKTGVGTLALSNANTYGGTTTINLGTLSISNDQALGATTNGTIINSGATLSLNGVAVGNENISLSGGTLDSTGVSSLSGALTLGAATMNNINANAGSTFTLNGAVNGPGGLAILGAGNVILNGNIGNTSALSIFTTNTNTSLNSATVSTTGNQTYANNILLSANKTFSSTSGNIDFMGTVDGNFDLTVATGGQVEFDNVIGGTTALNSLNITSGLDATTGGIILNSPVVNTNGNQNYTGTVTLNQDTTFNTSANNSTIAINNGLKGNKNVTMAAGALSSNETFMLAGTLDANNITVTGGSGGGNALTVNSGNTQNWTISNIDSGNVTGAANGNITYTNVTNLTGGAGNDNFVFNGNGSVNSINGSGGNNALDYTQVAYGVNIALIGNITSGTASGGVNTFSNINNLETSLSNVNTLQLPNKNNTITITGSGAGYINDPTFFTGMTGFSSTSQTDTVNFNTTDSVVINGNSANVGGTNMTFNNFGPNLFGGNSSNNDTVVTTTPEQAIVPAVMQQASTNQNSNSDSDSDSPNYVINTVSDNITTIIKDISAKFDTDLSKVKINPYCYAAK